MLPTLRTLCCADQCVVMLSQDSFYKDLTEEDLRDVKSAWPVRACVLAGSCVVAGRQERVSQ